MKMENFENKYESLILKVDLEKIECMSRSTLLQIQIKGNGQFVFFSHFIALKEPLKLRNELNFGLPCQLSFQ